MIKKVMNDFLHAVCDGACGAGIENEEQLPKLVSFHKYMKDHKWKVIYASKPVDKYYHYCPNCK